MLLHGFSFVGWGMKREVNIIHMGQCESSPAIRIATAPKMSQPLSTGAAAAGSVSAAVSPTSVTPAGTKAGLLASVVNEARNLKPELEELICQYAPAFLSGVMHITGISNVLPSSIANGLILWLTEAMEAEMGETAAGVALA